MWAASAVREAVTVVQRCPMVALAEPPPRIKGAGDGCGVDGHDGDIGRRQQPARACSPPRRPARASATMAISATLAAETSAPAAEARARAIASPDGSSSSTAITADVSTTRSAGAGRRTVMSGARRRRSRGSRRRNGDRGPGAPRTPRRGRRMRSSLVTPPARRSRSRRSRREFVDGVSEALPGDGRELAHELIGLVVLDAERHARNRTVF